MSRFNRFIVLEFYEVVKGQRVQKLFEDDENNFFVQSETTSPLEVNVSFFKTITNQQNVAQINIANHPLVEDFYLLGQGFLTDLEEMQIEVDIIVGDTGSRESTVVFTGDAIGFQTGVSGGTRSLHFTLATGAAMQPRAMVNKTFETGETYAEIIQRIFDEVLTPDYGIRLDVLEDPKGALNRALERPLSVTKVTSGFFSELTTGLNQDQDLSHPSFYWGLGVRQAGFISAYFVDRQATFDLKGDGGVRTLNHETGRTGIIKFDKDHFSFSHAPDVMLDIGVSISTTDYPQISQRSFFEGRIDTINAQLSLDNNFTYQITCSWLGKDGLALQPTDRRYTTGYLL